MRKLMISLAAALAVVSLHAQSADMVINLNPAQFFFPFPGVQGTSAFSKYQGDLFNFGYQPNISVGANLFGFLETTADFGYTALWANGLDKPYGITQFGASVTGYVYPISRIRLDAGLGGGYYIFSGNSTDQATTAATFKNAFLTAELGAAIRLSPGLLIRLNGAYTNYLAVPTTGDWESLVHGMSAAANLDLDLGAAFTQNGTLQIYEKATSPILPLFYSSYKTKPVTTVKVTNTEQAEIRDLQIQFNPGTYGASTVLSATIPYLGRGESKEIPVVADFSERVLALTEATKIQGEMTVSYKLLDSPRVVRQPLILKYEHRNSLVWSDQQAVASFISPTDPAVLEFSKFVAGMVRNRFHGEINKNLQFGLGVFEAMRLSGITVAADTITPYSTFHLATDKTDYVQYPYQTLAYKSGDSDDAAVLYACALSSVGVKAALIPCADEMLLAFSLDMDEKTALSSFADPNSLIYQNGQAWLPIRVSVLREGFMRAWQAGSERWQELSGVDQKASFFELDAAWKIFPPVGLPNVEVKVAKPSEESLAQAFDNTMNRFIKREIAPKLSKLQAEMPGGKGTPKQLNNLGILYARYGLMDEAKASFKQAGDQAFAPALVNLGNIAMLERQYEQAILIFEAVLKLQPNNLTVLAQLAQARYEMNDFAESDQLLSRMREINGGVADRYSYLSSVKDTGTGRAADVGADSTPTWDSGSEE